MMHHNIVISFPEVDTFEDERYFYGAKRKKTKALQAA